MAIYRFTFAGHFDDGVITRTGLHYVTQPPELGDEPPAADVLSAINAALYTPLSNCFSAAWNYDFSEVVEQIAPGSLDVPRGAVASSSGNRGNIAVGGNELPESMAAIISLKTGVPKRWARGYIALPSPKNADRLASGGVWDATFLGFLGTLAGHLDDDYSLRTAPADTSIIPVVYSRTQHGRGAPQPWAQVESAVVRSRPSWRRSRMSAP